MRLKSDKLQCWFNLSYASFLTLPRVFMEVMPIKWQDKMAELLFEYDKAHPNWPEGMGSRVQITQYGKLVKTPNWLINYRHPDFNAIKKVKK